MLGAFGRQKLTARVSRLASFPPNSVEAELLERRIAPEDLDDVLDALDGVAGVLSPDDAVREPFERTEHWPNRYNTSDFSALYTALDYATALAEITFHLGNRVAQGVPRYFQVLEMSFDGIVLDLSGHQATYPDLVSPTSAGYPFCQSIAVAARAVGVEALHAPSARNAGGMCVPIFVAATVSSPRFTQKVRFTFDGADLKSQVL